MAPLVKEYKDGKKPARAVAWAAESYVREAESEAAKYLLLKSGWSKNGAAGLIRKNQRLDWVGRNMMAQKCFLEKGAQISQSFKVAARGKFVFEMRKGDKSWAVYNNYYRYRDQDRADPPASRHLAANGRVCIDDKPVVPDLFSDSGYGETFSETVELDAGRHVLTIYCTQGEGMWIDNVKLTPAP